MTRLVPLGFGVLTAIVTAQTDPLPLSVQQTASMGIAGILVWWLTHSFQQSMERLARAQDATNSKLEDLARAVRDMPCTEVEELKAILRDKVAAARAAKEKTNT